MQSILDGDFLSMQAWFWTNDKLCDFSVCMWKYVEYSLYCVKWCLDVIVHELHDELTCYVYACGNMDAYWVCCGCWCMLECVDRIYWMMCELVKEDI